MDAAGLDRQELARSLVRGAVQMVVIDGFFHADPHPGNMVVELANDRLTFLDTGMVGELDLRKRISFAHFLLAFRDKDVSGMATALPALSTPFREPNESATKESSSCGSDRSSIRPPGNPLLCRSSSRRRWTSSATPASGSTPN
jgi:predicted unusual protein kinase regulating ubiquinone biosynthesis (AarF/ABC1/UbiB family)